MTRQVIYQINNTYTVEYNTGIIVIQIVPLHVTVTPQISAGKHCSTTTLNYILAPNVHQNSNKKTL
jgi:hypothetical protein